MFSNHIIELLFKLIEKLLKELFVKEQMITDGMELFDYCCQENERLSDEIKRLNKIIGSDKCKPIKLDSRNSNIPSSKDIVKPKRTKSLRQKSDKPSGGQFGHIGSTLLMTSNPDKEVNIYKECCDNCGSKFCVSDQFLLDKRQQVDITFIPPITTQFNRFAIVCPCGRTTKPSYPENINSAVQYGPNIRAMINYLSVYQYMPYNRIKDVFSKMFNLSISEGTISNTLKRSANKCAGIYEFIKLYLAHAAVVGADETPIKTNDGNDYLWVWQNKQATFIKSTNNRAKGNIYTSFPYGFLNAVLVSDGYRAHLSTPCLAHQLCWVHLLRKINYLIEAENPQWPNRLKQLYEYAKQLEKEKAIWKKSDKKIMELENEINKLLIHPINKEKYPQTRTFQNTLTQNRHSLFTFLYYPDVPSHNNTSEQAIRNAKVKLKVSGFFKTGQQYYAILRSVIDTLIKNGNNVFDALVDIENGIDIRIFNYKST